MRNARAKTQKPTQPRHHPTHNKKKKNIKDNKNKKKITPRTVGGQIKSVKKNQPRPGDLNKITVPPKKRVLKRGG
ncbi:hypothetical protein, partial [Enterobacter roggenkampii]|uniref:hypothetical protein n=1 Tax=Enterobacter roggenkampii TaxID=1812935 RepID=UPI00197AE898